MVSAESKGKVFIFLNLKFIERLIYLGKSMNVKIYEWIKCIFLRFLNDDDLSSLCMG